LAKVHHPDKGGDAVVFGRIQRAFQILSDPQKRAVYDTWAQELQFRYVRASAHTQRSGVCCHRVQ
jgi:curved DNA-binding protein CbpA